MAEDVRQNGVDEAAPAIVYWPAMMPNPFVAGQINSARTVTFVMHTGLREARACAARFSRQSGT